MAQTDPDMSRNSGETGPLKALEARAGVSVRVEGL